MITALALALFGLGVVMVYAGITNQGVTDQFRKALA